MPKRPSTNGDNGRDARGQFTQGNPGGPGNPFSKAVARLRSALIGAITEEDVAEVARKLLEEAKGGDLAAARVLLEYVIGRPREPVDPDIVNMTRADRLLAGHV